MQGEDVSPFSTTVTQKQTDSRYVSTEQEVLYSCGTVSPYST